MNPHLPTPGQYPIKNLGERLDSEVINPHLSSLPLFSSDTMAVQAPQDTFPTFGHKVLSCEVLTDERGYTFVHDDSAEAVEFSIRSVDAVLLGDKSLR